MARNPLIVKLWGVLESEDPNSVNAQIAKILIKNRRNMEHTTSTYLAKLCNVSTPSISRFSRILGYENFFDFRVDLKRYVPNRGRRFTAMIEGASDNLFDNYTDYIYKNLSFLNDADFRQSVQELVADMRTYATIYFMGNMQSGNTAMEMEYQLCSVKPDIIALNGYSRQKELLHNLKPDVLYVIFSVSGDYLKIYFREDEKLEKAKGSKIWMITSEPTAQKTAELDGLINTKTGHEGEDTTISQEITANLITTLYFRQLYDKNVK